MAGYTYSAGDPVNHSDPTGLYILPTAAATAATPARPPASLPPPTPAPATAARPQRHPPAEAASNPPTTRTPPPPTPGQPPVQPVQPAPVNGTPLPGDPTTGIGGLVGIGVTFLFGGFSFLGGMGMLGTSAGAAGVADAGMIGAAITGCGMSFTPDTRVLMASGETAPIAGLRPGDQVLARNVKSGKTSPERVAAVLVNHDTDLYDLQIRSGQHTAVIHTTASHLFWDPAARRWVKAASLRVGEPLQTPDGRVVTAAGGSTPKDHAGWMWDLTVPGNDDHDFYVMAAVDPGTGSAGYAYTRTWSTVAAFAVLVHNCSATLGRNLRGAREYPTGLNDPEAHHIVPENHPLAQNARNVLRSLGIDIDSTTNGVWLSHDTHRGTFTNAYARWINQQVVDAANSGGYNAVIDVLSNAKSTLQGIEQYIPFI